MKLPSKKQAAKTAAAAKSARVSKPAPARPRKRFTIRKRTVLIILAVCFVTIVGSALFARHQASVTSRAKQDQAYQADKARFAQVEADMQAAYDAMIAAAGTPAKTSQTKECSRESLKFEEGQLSCGISYDFAYPSETYAQAIGLTLKLQKAVLAKGYELAANTKTATDLDSKAQTGQDVTIYFRDSSEVRCNIYFQRIKPELVENFKDVNSSYIARYVFGCSKDMQAPIYPLAQ